MVRRIMIAVVVAWAGWFWSTGWAVARDDPGQDRWSPGFLHRPERERELGPGDFRYWIDLPRKKSLGLHGQILLFFLTAYTVAVDNDRLKRGPLIVAGTVATAALIAFVCCGVFMSRDNARTCCMLLNGLQLLVFAGILTHKKVRWMSRV